MILNIHMISYSVCFSCLYLFLVQVASKNKWLGQPMFSLIILLELYYLL